MSESTGVYVPGLSSKEIESKSEKARERFFVKSSGHFPAIQVIEFVFPLILPEFDFLVLPDSEMGEDLARTWPDQLMMHISESVYEGALDGNGSCNHVLAHEVGHLVLHRNIPPSFAKSKSNPKYASYFNSEWQADQFADAITMPNSDVQLTCETVQDIVNRYRVPVDAAKRRFEQVFQYCLVSEKSQDDGTRTPEKEKGQCQLALDLVPKD